MIDQLQRNINSYLRNEVLKNKSLTDTNKQVHSFDDIYTLQVGELQNMPETATVLSGEPFVIDASGGILSIMNMIDQGSWSQKDFSLSIHQLEMQYIAERRVFVVTDNPENKDWEKKFLLEQK